jgi:hypothetical protein
MPAPTRKEPSETIGANHRQSAAAGDPETEQNDVSGHVRREHPAEREIADGVDKARRERQHQQRAGQWMAGLSPRA